MRVAPGTAPSDDYSQYALLTFGGQYGGHCPLSQLGCHDDWSGAVTVKSISQPSDVYNCLKIGQEWQEYVIDFEVGRDLAAINQYNYSLAKYGLRFGFIGVNTAFVPIDIGCVSLVKLDADGNVVPASEIIGNDGTWYSDKELVNGKAEISDCESLLNEYYRAEGVAGTNTAIVPNRTDALEAGVYHITGNFRVGPDADAAAKFSAALGGAVLKILNGADSVNLTSGWSSVTFVIDTAVDGYSMNDIMLMIDSDIDLEFSSVSIEQIERYVKLSDVNVGTVMTLLMLLKAHEEGRHPIRDYDGVRVELPVDEMPYAPVEGNLMSSSDLTRRKNWIYGDQTLAFRYDDEGVLNITAKDITSNKAGFTFAPNVALRLGAYRFTGEFRTANEGEETVLRVYVAGKMHLFLATNEWTTIDVMFEVDEKTPITFTVKNGPDAYYTQPYEMRKLNITDFATAPFDVELETGGDFESESSMNRWSTASGAGDIERVTEDGNSFLRNTNRTVCYAGVNYALDANIIQGVAYKVTYDIRTSNPGDTMTARAHYYEGNNTSNTDLLIYGEASNAAGNEFEIDNEWRHVESVFVASLTGKFRFGINGGQDAAEDIKPFDIDNFKVIRLNYGERPGEYNDGDFEDPVMALLRWAPESDAGMKVHRSPTL